MCHSFKYFVSFYFICWITACSGDGGFFDWIWPENKNAREEIRSEAPLISVPFEAKTDDEKFLEEATKFTDIIKSSALDTCQHKVVLKIKTSCSSMTEEELAKMSVNLLNCQSAVDGRQTFPCTDSMTLKQCTEKMDATMWNAYHMMNNRARAVCLSARRSQFQALSEMTVNKLMSAAHNQIQKMNGIIESQNRLEHITLGTINLVEKGNMELLEQQDQLKSSQQGMHDFISHNLHDLAKEKALISTGHKELMKMIQSVKQTMEMLPHVYKKVKRYADKSGERLTGMNEYEEDETMKQLHLQSEEAAEHHNQLISDVEAIQKMTKEIFERIDASTDKLLLQHSEATFKYQQAVINLIKINETVHYLLQLVDNTRMEIDEKFLLMKNFLDFTGIEISKISAIVSHIAYLLIGMLFASFLNFSTLSRIILTSVILVNVFMTYTERTDLILDYSQMTVVLFATILCVSVFNRLLTPVQFRSSIQYHDTDNGFSKTDAFPSGVQKRFDRFRKFLEKLMFTLYSYMPSTKRRPEKMEIFRDCFEGHYADDSAADFMGEENGVYSPYVDRRSELSSQSFVRDWLQNKVPTPPSASSKSSNSQKLCSAICRSSSRRCRNLSSRGSEYCFRHGKVNSFTE